MRANEEEKCKQWVVAVGNISGILSLSFWCAGNERIGPNAVYHLVQYLVASYGKVPFVTRMVTPADRCHAYAECLGLPPEPEGRRKWTPPRLRVRHVPYACINDSGEVCERSLAGAPNSWSRFTGRQPHWVPLGDFSHCRRSGSRGLAIEECDSGYVAADKVMEHWASLWSRSGELSGHGQVPPRRNEQGDLRSARGYGDWAYGGSGTMLKLPAPPPRTGDTVPTAPRTATAPWGRCYSWWKPRTTRSPSNTLGKIQGGVLGLDFLSHRAGGKLDGHSPKLAAESGGAGRCGAL